MKNVAILLSSLVVLSCTKAVVPARPEDAASTPAEVPADSGKTVYPATAQASSDTSTSWGEIRYAHQVVNIREARTTASRIVGKLQVGDSVKVDSLEAGWYRVFDTHSQPRTQAIAKGYVHAPLLHPYTAERISVSTEASVPSAKETSRQTLPAYRLSAGDIARVPLPTEAIIVAEDRAPSSLGIDQVVYSVPWNKDRIVSFFDRNMPREGFRKGRCNEFAGLFSCLYERGTQKVVVGFDHGKFTLTQTSR